MNLFAVWLLVERMFEGFDDRWWTVVLKDFFWRWFKHEIQNVSNPIALPYRCVPLQSSLWRFGTYVMILLWINCKWCNSFWYLTPKRPTTALNHQFLDLRKCTRARGAKHFPFPFFVTICSLLSYRILNFTASVSKQRLFYRLGCTFIQYIAPSLYLVPNE